MFVSSAFLWHFTSDDSRRNLRQAFRDHLLKTVSTVVEQKLSFFPHWRAVEAHVDRISAICGLSKLHRFPVESAVWLLLWTVARMHVHMFRQADYFSRDEEHECIRQPVGSYICVPLSSGTQLFGICVRLTCDVSDGDPQQGLLRRVPHQCFQAS